MGTGNVTGTHKVIYITHYTCVISIFIFAGWPPLTRLDVNNNNNNNNNNKTFVECHSAIASEERAERVS